MEDLDRRILLGAAGLAGAAAISRLAHAGPLTPPAGAVAATGKTTQEVYDKVAALEPRIPISAATTPGTAVATYRITQPGSYYLTSNFTASVGGLSAILIATENVTIDLNGFSLDGADLAGGGSAITTNGNFQYANITVRNGAIRRWTGTAFNCPSLRNCSFRDLHLYGSSSSGMLMQTADLAHFFGCRFNQFNATSIGLRVGSQNVIQACTFYGGAISLYARGLGNVVEQCTVAGAPIGIQHDFHGNLTRECAIYSCATGINLFGGGSAIEGCTVSNCSTGIDVLFNTLSATTGGRNRILNNHIVDNGVSIASTRNGLHIRANSQGNHVEGNTFLGNFRSAQIDSTNNLFIRNTSAQQTGGGDFTIAAGNSVGTIINATSGGSPTTTDINANIRY